MRLFGLIVKAVYAIVKWLVLVFFGSVVDCAEAGEFVYIFVKIREVIYEFNYLLI